MKWRLRSAKGACRPCGSIPTSTRRRTPTFRPASRRASSASPPTGRWKNSRWLRRSGTFDVVGVHAHIGSQLTEVTPFVEALKKVVKLVESLKGQGINIRYLNIGGGLGITYSDEKPPLPQELADAVSPLVKDLDVTLVMEPGRVIVGNAGILVTKALYEKTARANDSLSLMRRMNDLIRPSLYGAYHDIRPVSEALLHRPKHSVDVVGPVCESGDFLAKDRSLPEVKPGDLLAVMSAGAYGFVMASNYNSRPRVPEVLVKDGEMHVIRARETYDDLVRGETIPAFLS